MVRLLKVLSGLVVVLATAVPISAASGAPGDPTVPIRLLTRREPTGVMVRGCLAGIPRDGTTELRRAQMVVRVDGAVVADVATIAGEDGFFDDSADCPEGALVRHRLTLDVLARAGVDPSADSWTTFNLAMDVDVSGHTSHFAVSQPFSIGEGAPTGAITSATWTASGAVLRGWAANPSTGNDTRLVVTVDGRPWTPLATAPASGVRWFSADQPTSDPLWVERGFADALQFEILAPAGNVCVAAVDDRSDGHPTVPIGCRTSSTNGLATAGFSAIETIPTPGTWGSTVRVRGTVSDPWADPGELPRLTLVAGTQRWPVTATAAPDLLGPLSDGGGAFRFDHTFTAVAPGTVPFCVVASYGTEPLWWLGFINAQPQVERQLACTDAVVPFQVPRPPIGTVDRIDVAGRTVTAHGWALDLNGGSPRVLLAVNGFPAAIGNAQLSRPDVRSAVGGDGTAGFALSAQLGAGAHDVCLLWEDTTTGQWSPPACQQVVVK